MKLTEFSGRNRGSRHVLYFIGLLALLYIFSQRVSGYQETLAWSGFSPLSWVYRSAYPENFIADFPSGNENFSRSAFMMIYPLFWRVFSTPPEDLLPFVLLFEYLFMAFSFLVLMRVLFEKYDLVIGILVILLVCATRVTDMDFARFGAPFFVGQYYCFAHGARLLAIAAMLKKKYLTTAVWLALAFMTHPTIGVMSGIFIAVMSVFKDLRPSWRQFFFATSAFLALSLPWLFIQFSGASIASKGIPAETWLSMTRLFSFHWYPMDIGVLGHFHDERFFPFLGMCILLATYLTRPECASEKVKWLLPSNLFMLGLVAVGFFVSAFFPHPVLVKLALHRANDVIALIGICYIVKFLYSEALTLHPWYASLAMVILLAPFFDQVGFPVFLCVLLAGPRLIMNTLKAKHFGPGATTILVLTAAPIIAVICYHQLGILKPWSTPAYFGGPEILRIWVGLLLLFLSLKLLRWIWPFVPNMNLLRFAILGLFLGSLPFSLKIPGPLNPGEKRGLFRSYLDVQQWAKKTSAHDAMFMVDPTIFYGWQDFSHRSSFGNMREWLHTAWLYDGNVKNYKLGMERFNTLGVNLEPYLNAEPLKNNSRELYQSVRGAYYQKDDEWRRTMARNFGIDYFVLQKDAIIHASGLPTVFENDDFLVLAVD